MICIVAGAEMACGIMLDVTIVVEMAAIALAWIFVTDILDNEKKVEALVNRVFDLIDGFKSKPIDWIEIEGN
jgi:hypothetical protein